MPRSIPKRALRWVMRQPGRIRRHLRVSGNLPREVETVRHDLGTGRLDFDVVRRETLRYVAANRLREHGVGRYSYLLGGQPILYASAYAALTRHLYGDLDELASDERTAWITYLQSHQSDDGLFRDAAIGCPDAEEMDWWGWRHMTLHVLMALGALGGMASKPFRIIQPFRKPGCVKEWLAARNWRESAACVSNEVQNVGTMLQYARDFQGEAWCDDALRDMFDWLDAAQDERSGCWGYGTATPHERSQAVQTGYHFWCLYFYDRRPVRRVERIVDTCLATQNRLGGFGVQLNSSACEDIDSVDPLARLCLQTGYRHADVYACLNRALPWVLANRNPRDGGWVFRRHQPYRIVPHRAMWAGENESFMAYTWFRTLSLAYLAKALPTSQVASVAWHFSRFPGHQFWP